MPLSCFGNKIRQKLAETNYGNVFSNLKRTHLPIRERKGRTTICRAERRDSHINPVEAHATKDVEGLVSENVEEPDGISEDPVAKHPGFKSEWALSIPETRSLLDQLGDEAILDVQLNKAIRLAESCSDKVSASLSPKPAWAATSGDHLPVASGAWSDSTTCSRSGRSFHTNGSQSPQSTAPSTLIPSRNPSPRPRGHSSDYWTSESEAEARLNYLRVLINKGWEYIWDEEHHPPDDVAQYWEDLLHPAYLPSETSVNGRYRIGISVHIAVIKLQRGQYANALEDFEASASMAAETAVDINELERCFLRRWVATARLFAGEYALAIQDLEDLSQMPRMRAYRTSILIDMADASVRQGNYQKARSILSDARKCLQREPLPLEESETPIPAGYHELDSTLSGILERREKMRYELLGYRLSLVQSKISYAWGDFRDALMCSREAWKGARDYYGSRHGGVVEYAIQFIMCTMYTPEALEAYVLAKNTHKNAFFGLGAQHPLTLEVLGSWTITSLLYSQFRNAFTMAKSAAADASHSLGSTHPLAIRSRCLFAEVQLAIGYTDLAVAELEGAIADAEAKEKTCGLDTLPYKSLLALAKHHEGSTLDAHKHALEVLQKGKSTFHQEGDNERDRGFPLALLPAWRTIVLIQEGEIVDGEANALSMYFRMVQLHRISHGEASILTQGALYDLALPLLKSGYKNQPKMKRTSPWSFACQILKSVYEQRCDLFSVMPDHVVHGSVRRDLIRAEYLAGQRSLVEIEEDSRCIYMQHEHALSIQHTETLTSLAWLLSVRFLLWDEEAVKKFLREELEQIDKGPFVRLERERSWEISQLRRRLASLVKEVFDPDKDQSMLDKLCRDVCLDGIASMAE